MSRSYEITYFDNNDSQSGVPMVATFKGRDSGEAVTQFNHLYPTKQVWSIDEVDPDYSLEDANLE